MFKLDSRNCIDKSFTHIYHLTDSTDFVFHNNIWFISLDNLSAKTKRFRKIYIFPILPPQSNTCTICQQFRFHNADTLPNVDMDRFCYIVICNLQVLNIEIRWLTVSNLLQYLLLHIIHRTALKVRLIFDSKTNAFTLCQRFRTSYILMCVLLVYLVLLAMCHMFHPAEKYFSST